MIANNARSLAIELLTKVEEEGAYANLLLQRNLSRLSDTRDRQLTTILVNGTLKNRQTLDYILRLYLNKPMSNLPREVRWILRVGAFQILYLDRIPSAAAINEGVESAKLKFAKYSGLVNGVLRNVFSQGWDFAWPDLQKEPIRYLSVRYSHPDWMIRRWFKRWGFSETEELCRANNEPAPTWIRTNTLKTSRDDLLKQFEDEGIKAEKGLRVPDSLRLLDFGPLERLESFRSGLFTVQDESSQLVAHVLSPQEGQSVLDACAAPGGKTTHLAQKMGNVGRIEAFDVYPHKLELIGELAKRLGVSIIRPHLGDARELPGIEPNSQDKVLVDAPCSGLGVLRRRADLRWQKKEDSLKDLPALQLAILTKAAACVKKGGEILYSTCTIEPEENFEVVKAFKETHPDFVTVDLREALPYHLTDEKDIKQARKGMLQLLPHHHGMDGFFLAKLHRI